MRNYILFLCLLSSLQADYIGESKAPLLLHENTFELSYRYGAMNDTLDIFNVKESEFSTLSSQQTNGLGDYQSSTLVGNYSPSDNSLFNLSLASQTISYGGSSLDVLHYETFGRYVFHPYSHINLGIDIGLRGNKGKKISMSSAADLQYYLNSLGKNIQASETSEYLWLTKNYTNLALSVGFPKDKHPELSINNMSDRTFFGRTSISWESDDFSPSCYIEVGNTAISTTLDTNMDDIAGDNFKELFAQYTDFPIHLDRNEHYSSIGFNLITKTFFDTTLTTNYEYTRLFRDADINTFNTNHTLKMNLSYEVSSDLTIMAEGTYMHRQFNTAIPFLYNEYSKNTFDHPYGWLQFGVSYTFNK